MARPRGFCTGAIQTIVIVMRALEKFASHPLQPRKVCDKTFQIAELKREQRMTAGAVIAPVPDGVLLVRRAHGNRGRSIGRKDGRALKASCPPRAGAFRNDPCGLTKQPFPQQLFRRRSRASRDRGADARRHSHLRSQQVVRRETAASIATRTGRPFLPRRASAGISPRQNAQIERVVECAIGKQSGVGCHNHTAKLKYRSPVEIGSESLAIRFNPPGSLRPPRPTERNSVKNYP